MANASFRRTLLGVAEDSFRAGKLSRFDVFRIRMATAIPSVCQQLEDMCFQNIVMATKAAAPENVDPAIAAATAAPDPSAIDWQALIEALKELLPVIIEFIKMIISLFP